MTDRIIAKDPDELEAFLIKAAFTGDMESIIAALDEGININYLTRSGLPLLQDAYLGRQYKTVKLLIERGADVNAHSESVHSLLHHAALVSNNAIGSAWAMFLIENGADVNRVGPNGVTPLMVAAVAGDLALVQRMIRAGADVTSVSNEGETALGNAARIYGEVAPIVGLIEQAMRGG